MSGCENCWFRAKYDKNPRSLLGRMWRWHIGFCPGWKKHFRGLSEEKQQALSLQYKLKAK
ncbi:hypothetical protein CA13_67890 [Planctomycetes bacterium CA13]|uniref:Uncharacterized protein n=1 Tax=Novipirellula herctigrandis TaxID=2527986 RepID=A0A5C5YN37_9BACT|nr:hypothetical protein CA13_67890 [Planctomycetes bacterium CA13]